MADEKPSIEEIRARWTRASRGPWRQGAVERYHVYTPDGARMGPERVLLRMNEHFAYEADAEAIAHAPTDVAWLLERDAAKDARIAELEAELAGKLEDQHLAELRTAVIDFADHVLGVQDVVPPTELLSRVAKWIFELRQERARLEAELSGIRERARIAIRIKRQGAIAYEGSSDPGDVADACFLRDDAEEIARVVGLLDERAPR